MSLINWIFGSYPHDDDRDDDRKILNGRLFNIEEDLEKTKKNLTDKITNLDIEPKIKAYINKVSSIDTLFMEMEEKKNKQEQRVFIARLKHNYSRHDIQMENCELGKDNVVRITDINQKACFTFCKWGVGEIISIEGDKAYYQSWDNGIMVDQVILTFPYDTLELMREGVIK